MTHMLGMSRAVFFAIGVALLLLNMLWLVIVANVANAGNLDTMMQDSRGADNKQDTITVPVTWTQRNEDGFGLRDVQGVVAFAVFDDQLYAGTSAWDGSGARRLFRSSDGQIWDEVIGVDFERLYSYEIQSLAVYSDMLYAGTTNFNWLEQASEGAEIWRSSDGLAWSLVITGGLGDPLQASVVSLAAFDGHLYAGTYSITTTHAAEIWRAADGANWQRVVIAAGDDVGATSVRALHVYSDVLFAAVSNYADGAEIWRSENGITWTKVLTGGFGNSARPSAVGLVEFGDHLYSYLTGGDGVAIVRCQMCDGGDWSIANAPGFGNPGNVQSGAFAATERALLVAVGNGDSGIEVWRTQDGATWQLISSGGFGDSNNQRVTGGNDAITVVDDRLYLGTWNEETGGEIWSLYLGPTSLVEVERNANLRDGPGTSYAVVGGVQAGQLLEVVGANADSSWVQLGNDAWISASLVKPVEREGSTESTAASLPVTATLHTQQSELLADEESSRATTPQQPTTAVSLTSALTETLAATLQALETESWRQQVDMVISNGKTQAGTVVEFEPPDRYHIVVEGGIELIFIGQDAYVKDGDAWTESDISVASVVSNPDWLTNGASDFEMVGADTLDGNEMRVYLYTPTSEDAAAALFRQAKLWVGAADNRLYKIVMDGDVVSVNTETGKTGQIAAEITALYEYDLEITIDPPVK